MVLKEHKCTKCDAAYKRICTLQRHKRAKHNHKKPFRCKTCEDAFSTRRSLKGYKYQEVPGIKILANERVADQVNIHPKDAKEHLLKAVEETHKAAPKESKEMDVEISKVENKTLEFMRNANIKSEHNFIGLATLNAMNVAHEDWPTDAKKQPHEENASVITKY